MEKTFDEVLKEHEPKIQAEKDGKKAASHTPITRPLQEIQEEKDRENREKFKALSATLGIDKQNEEIDGLKKGQDLILQKLNEFAAVISQQSEVLNTITQGGQTAPQNGGPQVDQLQKIQLLTELMDSKIGDLLIKKLGGGEPAPVAAPLISQEYINEKMRNSVMENFELGETILDAVKSTLKKKAVKGLTDAAIQETGLSDHGVG